MNYNVFKSMLDVLVKTYKCPFCQAEVSENNIEIVGTAGITMNIEIGCPSCQKHSIVKAEVAQIDARTMNFKAGANLEEIKANLSSMFKNEMEKNEVVSENPIKDKDIVSLSRGLQAEDIKVEDLFR